MEYTTNLNLKKADENDFYSVTEQTNTNLELIDEAVGALNESLNELNSNLLSIQRRTGTFDLNGKSHIITLEQAYNNLRTGFIVGLNAYHSSNANATFACAVQQGQHLRFYDVHGYETGTVVYEYFILKINT